MGNVLRLRVELSWRGIRRSRSRQLEGAPTGDRTDPENLEVLLDDRPAMARRERDRLIVRRVSVETFHPERGR